MQPAVLCIGVANVDVISQVDTNFMILHRIDKATSTLMRSDDLMKTIAVLDNTALIPGGGAANTACGVGAEGIQTRFIGMIHDDAYGKVFADGFKPYNVEYTPMTHPEKHTALCLTLVTPDKERSFAFSPDSASWFLSDSDLPPVDDATPLIVYTETNLLRMTAGTQKESMLHAVVDHYATANSRVILNLIDTEITSRHRQTLKQMMDDGKLYMVISNIDELMALFDCTNAEAALSRAHQSGQLFITTRGPEGATITSAAGSETVRGQNTPLEDIVNTIGAGDQFAAGIIASLARNDTLHNACLLGARRAAAILRTEGARPEVKTQDQL